MSKIQMAIPKEQMKIPSLKKKKKVASSWQLKK